MNKLSPKTLRLDAGWFTLLAVVLMLLLGACGYNTPTGGGGLTPFIVVVTPTPAAATRTANAQLSLPSARATTVQAASTNNANANNSTTEANNPTATSTSTPELVGNVYTVQKGDTLTGIAHKFGVEVRAIIKLNNIANADNLQIGQKLQIPSPQPTTPTPNA